jgi:hypothetical protein
MSPVDVACARHLSDIDNSFVAILPNVIQFLHGQLASLSLQAISA